VTVLEDGRTGDGPSFMARVMGAAQWCCSCSIYSNRQTHEPLELLEVKSKAACRYSLISATATLCISQLAPVI